MINGMKKEEGEEQEVKAPEAAPALSDFVLSLIQAFLKTGYYRSDHPEARKAKAGLYEALKNFLEGKREISFISSGEAGKPELYIGGIFDEPVTGSSIMMKGMAEIFIPKFIEYFERKHLSSFSMKSAISEGEFEKFIEIMTESPLYDRETDVQEKLTLDLIKQEVLMVSTVFNVDLVGKARKLPWRVELSISRLKRDLNLVPLYKNVSEGKKEDIRKMVFEDIVRPLKSSGLAKELIENLDLISSDLIGFAVDDFETKIIEHLDESLLPVVSKGILEDISRMTKAFDKLQEAELLVRLGYLKGMAKRIGKKLLGMKISDEDLFFDFVKCGVLTLEEVQGSVRGTIASRMSLDRFLASPQRFFDEINEAVDKEELKEKLMLLVGFIPTLFAEGRYADIRHIHALVREKGMDFKMHDDARLVEDISREANRRAKGAGKEEVTELLNVLSLIGRTGVFALVDMLDNGNRFARRSAIEILKQKGPAIIPFVLSGIDKKPGWYYLRNALTLLSIEGADSPEIEEVFKNNLGHSEPNVRKEAVRGLAIIMGEKAGEFLIPLLKDENGDVRRRVISSLAAIGCASPEAMDFFVNVLKNWATADDAILDTVLNALAETSLPRGREDQLEDALTGMLKDSSVFGFMKRKSDQDLKVKHGAIKALGALGTSKSVKTLKKYASDREAIISKAATEALRKIEGTKV
jgi:HEAT repeat protein